ncbi:hypothetical protein ACN9MZ_26140 [Pseudoduganella sp. S-14]|uniref:hypothetical protein n=1 Tax=Pseudoduganella sp. S-14 TaxID=3404065 RepID=UPI003CF44A7C
MPLEVIKDFDAAFVLVGPLAKLWGVNPTNLKEKLQSIGIHPVAGPGIDGVLTSLFRREDVRSLDPQTIIDIVDYPTKTGRRPDRERLRMTPARFLSSNDVSAILQISELRVATLVRKGILSKVPNSRPSRIERDSVARLQRLLASPDWTRLDDAAERVGCSVTVFRNTWVKSGVVRVRDLGPWKIVRTREVLHVLDLQSEYVTASQAGKSLGTHRSHVRNLERGGRIESVEVGDSPTLKLYRRKDVEERRDDTSRK